jgi:hypothetical protein
MVEAVGVEATENVAICSVLQASVSLKNENMQTWGDILSRFVTAREPPPLQVRVSLDCGVG